MKRLWLILFVINSMWGQEYFYFKDGSIAEGKMSKSNTSGKINISSKNKTFGSIDLISLERITTKDGELIYPKEFITNELSKKLHLPDFEHSPTRESNNVYVDRAKAIEDGYILCNACFNTNPKVPNYNLEMKLSNEISININNNYDILYEHPKRESLQKMVDNILENWIDDPIGYKYRVQVINDISQNAIAVPGGNIYINNGLLDIIESDSELMGVLSHEVAHVEKRHGLKQLLQSQINKKNALVASIFVGIAVSAAGGTEEDVAVATTITAAVGVIASEIVSLGYSRDLEEEADIIAQTYFEKINKKSYSDGMISILDKLYLSSVVNNPLNIDANAYSSHPSILLRIKQFKNATINYLEDPIIIELNNNKKKKRFKEPLSLSIHTIYNGEDKASKGRRIIFLLGEVYNPHLTFDLSLNLLLLNIIYPDGNIYAQKIDISNSIFRHNSSSQFSFKFSMSEIAFSKILPMFINKSFEVRRVLITAKEFDPVNGFSTVYGYKELEGNGIVK